MNTKAIENTAEKVSPNATRKSLPKIRTLRNSASFLNIGGGIPVINTVITAPGQNFNPMSMGAAAVCN